MQADRNEWLQLQKNNGKDSGRKNNVDSLRILEMLQQASVKSEQLTNDANWDYFLTLIQEWINVTKENAQHFRSALESPDLVNTESRKQMENYLLLCNERIIILDAVISLPKQIMENYGNAKLELEKIGKDKIEAETKLDI